MDQIYLDYNATSPLSKSVIDWLKSGDLHFGNPSSQHSFGKASRKVINETRSLIFKTFSQSDKDTKLFFHSGASEGMNSFMHSFAEMTRLQGKELLVCFSLTDHPAVTNLESRYWGSHVKFLHLSRDKELRYEHERNFDLLKDKKDNNPNLVILYHHLWVHNETGDVSALDELKIFKEIADLFIHVDAVQAPTKIQNWTQISHGDIWTFSGHKFGALKGIGFSLFKNSLPFYPLISGGGQQEGFRAGTENALGVKTVGLALEDALQVNFEETSKHRRDLEEFLDLELRNIGSRIRSQNPNSNTLYFYLNKFTSDIVLALFDLNGLSLSAGSACSSGSAKASPVLLQMGLNDVSRNGLRLSLDPRITPLELVEVKSRLTKVFHKLKSPI